MFAPSGDQTDNPDINSLYIVDSGLSSDHGDIVELYLIQQEEIIRSSFTAQAALVSTTVNTINTALWLPPSPDPAGAAYLPSSNSLLISDSEVNEIPSLFTGDNVFRTSLSGTLLGTSSTLAFSDEPTGVAYNPTNGHIFFSDDDNDEVYEVDTGISPIFSLHLFKYLPAYLWSGIAIATFSNSFAASL